MSEQENGQISTSPRPTTDNREEWIAYWWRQGQPWRTEPEIDTKRQEYLDERCGVIADIRQAIYPFKEVELSRADIEWLLAIFLNERGAIDWEEEYGLDLRGAFLHKVDLRGLPLRGMRCGLTEEEWIDLNEEARKTLTEEQKALFTEEDEINDEALPAVVRERLLKLLGEAGANLEEADLRGVDLSMAHFTGTKMKRAWFDRANLTKADLSCADLQWAHFLEAKLEEADLSGADLGRAYLRRAYAKGANFYGASMKKANLEGAVLSSANMADTHLEEAYLSYAILEQANFTGAHLDKARLTDVQARRANFTATCLKQVFLNRADLSGANLSEAHLEGASLCDAHMEQAKLNKAYLGGGHSCSTDLSSGGKLETKENVFSSLLEPANLSGTFFDSTTVITDAQFGDKKLGFASVADIHWNDLNLATVDWSTVRMLGDERLARQKKEEQHKLENLLLHRNLTDARLEDYRKAVRANRQLAVVLQSQGLNENAAYFTYRAQLTQRKVFWHERKPRQYLFSLFLDLLAGYGYRPERSFIAYLIVIAVFAITYFLIGRMVGPILSPLGAWVFSMTSFHGRGFFPGGIGLDDPLTVVAAFEAFVGLLIEVTFIATLTQRLFGK